MVSQMSKSKKRQARQVIHATDCVQQAASLASARRLKQRSPRCETLDELIDYAADVARELFGRQGFLAPIYLCEQKNGDHWLALPTEYGEDKDLLAGTMREVFKTHDVQRYVSITEVWTSALPPKDGSSLATNPDRGEALWLCAEDKVETRAAEMTILRPKRGKPKLSSLRKFPGTFAIGGRLSGLLSEGDEERRPRVVFTWHNHLDQRSKMRGKSDAGAAAGEGTKRDCCGSSAALGIRGA